MNSANSNTYSHFAEAARGRFNAHVHGAEAGGCAEVCVISAAGLGPTAESALTASAERLGFGTDACAFIRLAVPAPEDRRHALLAPVGSSLADADLHLLIESLDPRALVATDMTAAAALARIFHTALTAGKPQRILGRPTLAFADFSALLGSPEGKRSAWETLKLLVR